MSDDDIDPGISCHRCQACCCRLPVLVLPGDAPPQRLVEFDEHGSAIMGKGEDGWCLALDRDSMLCGIYEQRPWVCREFAMGGHECREERADWRRIQLELR